MQASSSGDAGALDRVMARLALVEDARLGQVLDKLLPRLIPMLNDATQRTQVRTVARRCSACLWLTPRCPA